MTSGASGPRLLVTGFGPFPGAPQNPTEALVRSLARQPATDFAARALRGLVLPTDYRRSWAMLRRAYARFAPDVVLHFGLSRGSQAIAIERRGCRRVHPERPDAAGFAPRSGLARRCGPETLPSSLPVDAIVQALAAAGFPAQASDDAGGYVCNATLYRSLLAAPPGASRLVGFVHVPPDGAGGCTAGRLAEAAKIIAAAASAAWAQAAVER